MRSILAFTFILLLCPGVSAAEQMRSLDYQSPKKTAPLYVPQTEEKEEPSEKVWERYKALAAGTATQEQATPAPVEKPKARPAGFAGLLQQYQENKKSRGGMRSTTIK